MRKPIPPKTQCMERPMGFEPTILSKERFAVYVFMARRLRFELRLNGLEPFVLPLHQRPKSFNQISK